MKIYESDDICNKVVFILFRCAIKVIIIDGQRVNQAI